MKNKQIFSESTPPRHKGLFARFFALFFCLVMGMNVWGETINLYGSSAAPELPLVQSGITISGVSTSSKNGASQCSEISDFPATKVYMVSFSSNAMLTIDAGANKKITSLSLVVGRNSSGSTVSQFGHGGFSTDNATWTGIAALSAKGYDKGTKIDVTIPSTGEYRYYSFGRGKLGSTSPSSNAEFRVYQIIITIDNVTSGGSDPISVTGVSLNKTTTSIQAGQTETLTATVAPANATVKTVTWTSDNETVATVANGVVTAKVEGTANITVTTTDGGFSASCAVTVTPAPAAPDFVFTKTGKPTSGNLAVGDEIAVTGGTMKVYSTKTETSLKWASDGLNFSGGQADQVIIETDKVFQVGSVISLTFKNNSLDILDESGTLVVTQAAPGTTYTVVAGDGLAGNNVFRLRRNSSSYLQSIEITGLGSAVATWNVTFDMQGATSAAIEAQSVKNGKKAVKPEDPEKTGYDFVKWVVASTEADYDFDAAVTADVALKAVWTPQVTKYTVTYAKGDEAVTGDVPTQESLAAGANFTVAEKGTLAWANHVFTGWKDQDDAAVAAGAEYTMPAKDVTLTAQWNVVTTYDVTFNLQGHGAAIETQHVIEGEKATEPADPKAELYTFGGWYTEAECTNAFDFANTTITAAKELFAKWTAFGEATSINIEQFVIDNGKSGDIQAALTAANFDFNLLSGDELDDLVADESKNDKNCAFRGLKLKHDGSFVVGNIPAGKLVDVVLGNLGAAKVQINGADAATALAAGVGTTNKTTPDNYKNSHNYYYSETAAVLKVLSTGTSTTVLKGINFLDPFVVTFANGGDVDPISYKAAPIVLPAATGEGEFQGWYDAETAGTKIGDEGDEFTPTGNVTLYAQFSTCSTNNEITSFTYGETTVTATEGKREYAIELPYKSEIPAVLTYESEAATKGEVAKADNVFTFTVTSECGEAADYTITFTVAPKDGICLIHADITGQGAASVDPAKSTIGGTATANGNVKNATSFGGETGYKFNAEGARMSITLAEGSFKTGDVVKMFITTAQAMPIRAYSDNDATIEVATGAENMVQGLNSAVMTADAATLYLARTGANGWNPNVAYVEVYRAMNPILSALTVAGVDATIDPEAKTISVKLPNGTVAADAVLVPTIIANGGEPTAALDGTLAYDTPINYVVTDKDGDQTTYVLTAIEGATPAAVPTITTQPQSHDYADTETIAALTVEATKSDAGVLSYQWYKGEEPVGENLPTYTPTEAGSYKVVVTNTLGTETATATSDVAVITVSHIYTFASWTEGATFTKAGEWTLYPYNSSTKELSETVYFATEQTISNVAGAQTATAFTEQYFVLKFEKPMKEVVILDYCNSSRYINNIYTLDVAAKKTNDVTSKFNKATSQDGTTKVSTTTLTTKDMHFDADVYYVFKTSSSSCNAIFDIFATEASVVDEFEGLVAGKIGDADMTDAQLADLNGAEHTLTLAGAVSVAPAVEFSYKHTITYDDAIVTDLASATETAVSARVGDNYEISKEIAGVTYKVVVPVDVTPALALDVTAGTAAIAGKTDRSKEFTVTLTGANLANGEYNVVVPTVDGLTVTPAAFTVAAGEVNETFTITYASDADVAEAVANIEFTANTLVLDPTTKTATFALTYSSVAWVEPVDVNDVTTSTTWNWNGLAGDDIASDNTEVVMSTLFTPTVDFESDKLLIKGSYAYRKQYNCFQGGKIKFHTTVPGFVAVEFANTGGNAARTAKVNGIFDSEISSTGASSKATYTVFVNAGDVIIEGIQVSDEAAKDLRLFKIEFKVATEVRSGLEAGRMYTYCPAQNAPAVANAEFYVPENFDGSYVNLIKVDELTAGYGYIMIPTASTVYAAFSGDALTEAVAASAATRGMQGYLNADPTYQEAIPDSDDNLIVANNHLYVNNNNKLISGRAYIRLDIVRELSAQTENPAPRRRIGFESTVTTGMEAIESVEAQKVLMDGVLYIIRAGKMYNVNGQLLK